MWDTYLRFVTAPVHLLLIRLCSLPVFVLNTHVVFPQSYEQTKVKAIYRSFERKQGLNGCVWNQSHAGGFSFRHQLDFSSSVTESDERTWRNRTSRRTDSFEVASQRDVMEQRREFSKEIKEGAGKVIKQYRTVFVSQGFLFFYDATPPLVQYNWTKAQTNWYFFLLTIWMKKGEQKSVVRQASSSCSSPCWWASASIHPRISRAIHP